jgi:2-keto-3-deoxy-L-rhamnonate aldolase RhmA
MAYASMKEMVRTRDLKVGHMIFEFATPGMGHICKAAGCDFLILDLEHTGFGYETIKAMLRGTEAAGLPNVVRVPSKEYHHIARACDAGAEGLMLPMVNDAKEAEGIIQCMKYHPRGQRGVGLGLAHDLYRPGPVMEKLAAANEKTTLFAQIETAAGVRNAEEIAAVDGVDCLWIGHFDLSASLGIPGDFGHKKFTDAIEKVRKACDRHGKSYGRLVPSVEDGIQLNKEGFDFICYWGDVWAYQAHITSAIQAIRDGAGGAKAAAKSRRSGKQKGGKKKSK